MWLPNAHNKSLYSHLLDRMVRLRVTAAALRCGGAGWCLGREVALCMLAGWQHLKQQACLFD